jgi:S1-C subfamily serine protease
LSVEPLKASEIVPRVGHLGIGIARSWSNNVTASSGIVAIIGGPLATGRRRAIEEVIRTTAPMHDGFAGGAFIDTEGLLIGIATAAEIRGLGVVIPARIAWQSAKSLLEHGQLERGYLGIAGQPVTLPDVQRQADDRADALLVVGVTADSPAAAAGVLVGDLLLDFDGHPIGSPEDLLDLLAGDRVGRALPLRILRGTSSLTATVTVGKRLN